MEQGDQTRDICKSCGNELKPGAELCPACLTRVDGRDVQRNNYEKPARLRYRLLAAFLDCYAVSMIVFFSYNMLPYLIGSVDWILLYNTLVFTKANPELYVVVVSSVYFLLPEMIWSTTPAKRMFSLLVRSRRGGRINPLQAVPRHLVRLGVIYLLTLSGYSWISACVLLMYYGTIVVSPKVGTLGDLLSGSIVVSDG